MSGKKGCSLLKRKKKYWAKTEQVPAVFPGDKNRCILCRRIEQTLGKGAFREIVNLRLSSGTLTM